MGNELQSFRARHPEFSELSDFEITAGLREKYQRQTGEHVPIELFSEAIGGPKLKLHQAPGAEPPQPSLPAREMQLRAPQEAPAPVPALAPGAPPLTAPTGLELPGEPGTPQAQLTGENLQPAIEGGRDLEESVNRFARGEAPTGQPPEIPDLPIRKPSEILAEQDKQRGTEAKKGLVAFPEKRAPLNTEEQLLTDYPILALATLIDSVVNPKQGVLETAGRRLSGVAAGTVSAGGGMIGYLGNKANIELLKEGALSAEELAAELVPPDPRFVDTLMQGFGSSAAFWIPGIGLARGTAALAKVSETAALWAGAGASAAMEAMAEAGSAFSQLVKDGIEPEEAMRRADEVFASNAALVTVFNRFGVFGERGEAVARALLTATAEGIQEVGQSIIGNVATDQPLTEGAKESFAVGALVGGGASLASGGGVLPAEEGAPVPPPPMSFAERAALQGDQPTPEEPLKLDEAPAEGKTRTVFTPRGDKVQVEFGVVDVADLVTSHDAEGNPNPDFPAELQPRDRGRKSSQLQTRKIAGALNPALLGDTPSVTDGAVIVARMPKRDAEGNPALDANGDPIMQNVVVSGNARTNALRMALGDDRGLAYREALPDMAAPVGIAPQELERFADPVLVRFLSSDVDLEEFARQANQSTTAELSPAEQARADAKRLTAADLSLFNPSQTGDPLAATNDQFIRIFLQRIGGEETARFTNAEGRPTKQLADRLNAAIFARVYGDARLVELQAEEANPQIKNILSALQAAAPAFARAKAVDEALGGLDVPKKIVDAVQVIRDAQARGANIDELLDQEDMLTERDPEVTAFARFIAANNRSAERMGRAFTTIAEFLTNEVRRQQTEDIFGDKGASLADLVAAANREIAKQNEQENIAQGGTIPDLFGANPPRVPATPPTEPAAPPGPAGREPAEKPGAAPQGPAAAPATPPPGPAGREPAEKPGAAPQGPAAAPATPPAGDLETVRKDLDAALRSRLAGTAAADLLTRAVADKKDVLELAGMAKRAAEGETFGVPRKELGRAVQRVFGQEERRKEPRPPPEPPTQEEIDEGLRQLAGMKVGSIDKIRSAIARGVGDKALAVLAGKEGPGVMGGSLVGRIETIGRGDKWEITIGGETIKFSGARLGKELRRIFATEAVPTETPPPAQKVRRHSFDELRQLVEGAGERFNPMQQRIMKIVNERASSHGLTMNQILEAYFRNRKKTQGAGADTADSAGRLADGGALQRAWDRQGDVHYNLPDRPISRAEFFSLAEAAAFFAKQRMIDDQQARLRRQREEEEEGDQRARARGPRESFGDGDQVRVTAGEFKNRQGQIQELEGTTKREGVVRVRLSPFGLKKGRVAILPIEILELERTLAEQDADTARGVPEEAPETDAAARARIEQEGPLSVEQLRARIEVNEEDLRRAIAGRQSPEIARVKTNVHRNIRVLKELLREAEAREAKARHDEAKAKAAPEPRQVTAADKRTAKALRKAADALDKQIEAKLNPATAQQNATPRRARIIESMMAEGRALQKTQAQLRALAERHENGTLVEILRGISTRPQLEMLRRNDFPTIRFPGSLASDMAEAFKGLKGRDAQVAREFTDTLKRNDELSPNESDLAAIRSALAQAKKAGRKDPLRFTFVAELLKDNARALKAGITNQEQWNIAKAALVNLEAKAVEAPGEEARRAFDKRKRDLVGQKGVGNDLFPTPPGLAMDLVERADAQEGDSVLEPSGGTGNIVEAMAEHFETFDIPITVIEQSATLVSVLNDQAAALRAERDADITVTQGDFLEYAGRHDVIIMNPPFSQNQDIAHVRHAWDLLKPGGRIVALMSEHPFFASDKASKEFRAWLAEVGGEADKLEPGDLADKRVTQRSNVSARIVEINKGFEGVREDDVSYSVAEPADEDAEQLALFVPEGAPKPKPPSGKPRVKQIVTGTVRAASDVIEGVNDAVHLVAPFRKQAQENFLAVVLGEGGRVLRVIRHSIGRVNAAAVDPAVIAGAIAETPGAKSVYFAHNHPSGRTKQSKDDHRVTAALAELLRESGIRMRAGLVVAPGSRDATAILVDSKFGITTAEISVPIEPRLRRVNLPMTERVLRRIPTKIEGESTIGSPSSARAAVKNIAKNRSGILFLDSGHRPVTFFPMSVAEMSKLRTGEVGTGTTRLLAEIAQQNHVTAIVVARTEDEGGLAAALNIVRFVRTAGREALDLMVYDDAAPGGMISMREKGADIPSTPGTFESREAGTEAVFDPEEESLEFVRRIVIAADGDVLISQDVDGDLSLDVLALPENRQRQGIGRLFMRALTEHADSYGRAITLSAGEPGDFAGKTKGGLERFYARFGFIPDKVGVTMHRPSQGVPGPAPVQIAGTSAMQAGARHKGFITEASLVEPAAGAPKKPTRGFGVLKTPIAPDRPLRRERILAQVERDFNVKIYEGRMQGNRSRLGFYRDELEELRARHNNDLEVVAHELAHLLDDRDPAFKRLYRQRRFKDEIRGVSYDVEKKNEGFAEFLRLFLTQEEEAMARAPGFYDAFVDYVRGSKWEKGLVRAQADMHAWFRQGAINRARSKIGADRSISGRVQDLWLALTESADRFADEAAEKMVDELQGLKVAERTLKGSIGDADQSIYKAMRLIRGIRGVVRSIFRHGTIGLRANGDVIFTGAGLRQVFEPIADVMDEAMDYFAGMRAKELFGQGRENLFRPKEIAALIARGSGNPRIVRAFEEFQAFNTRMMDFYVDAGILSAESRAIIEQLNKSYVPFKRIRELATGEAVPTKHGFQRLWGGTANTKDIYENIMENVAALTAMAVENRAKQKVYSLIKRSRGSAKFAARIPRETQAVKVTTAQVAAKIQQVLDDLDVRLPNGMPLGQLMTPQGPLLESEARDKFGDFMTFFTFGNAPIGDDIDSVMFHGKREYYQVADPMFMRAMLSFGWRPTSALIRFFGVPKRVLTFGVTGLPDFFAPNLIRDMVSGYLLRRSNMAPIVSSIRGLMDRVTKDEAYWLFLANGGGFASSVRSETGTARRELEKLYLRHHVPLRHVLDTPRRLMDWYLEFGSAFEYGTRLAEFKASVRQGVSLQEAAFRGREVSTDFAMRGSADWVRNLITIVPFLNARMQGLYRLEREAFERGGRQKLVGDKAGQLALRGLLGLTLPSLLLWWLNHDDERYQALPAWIKDLHWVIFVPGIEQPFLVPKPFEVGAIFGTIPERTADFIKDRDGAAYSDAIGFILAEQFGLAPIPQIAAPMLQHARNKSWTGAPVIPEDLLGVDPAEQFRPWSSETSIYLGQKLGLSPILTDHYIRGYFGTLGSYALMASDGLVSSGLPPMPAKSFSERPIVRRFTRALPLRRTSFEDEFYEMRDQIREVVNTFNKMVIEQRSPEVYLNEGNRKALFAMSSATETVGKQVTKINRAMRQITLAPNLSPDEKTAKLNEARRVRNKLFREAVGKISPRELERLREAGNP